MFVGGGRGEWDDGKYLTRREGWGADSFMVMTKVSSCLAGLTKAGTGSRPTELVVPAGAASRVIW